MTLVLLCKIRCILLQTNLCFCSCLLTSSKCYVCVGVAGVVSVFSHLVWLLVLLSFCRAFVCLLGLYILQRVSVFAGVNFCSSFAGVVSCWVFAELFCLRLCCKCLQHICVLAVFLSFCSKFVSLQLCSGLCCEYLHLLSRMYTAACWDLKNRELRLFTDITIRVRLLLSDSNHNLNIFFAASVP